MIKGIIDIFKAPDTNKVDKNVVLFFLNTLLVVIGYSTRGTSFEIVKLLRVGLLGLSIVSILLLKKDQKYLISGKSSVIWFFILLNLFVLVFSVDFVASIVRIFNWLPFLIYINYFIDYLFRRYNTDLVKIKLLQIFNLVYLYPLITLFVFGNPLINTNIYGGNVGGFKTNTFGWAGIMFFVTAIDILSNFKTKKKIYNRLLVFISIFAVYVIGITGSRSSYLCLVISLLILILNSKQIKFASKIAISLLIAGISFFMINDENSALNKRIKKTETQIEKGESRFEMAELALETMIENPTLLLTGFGFDNFQAGIYKYKSVHLKLKSHNSYLELFITTGIFTFTFFLIFYIINAIVKYIRYDIRKFIFLPTLLIIPFFESNLNAGQYLFFPWMTFLFYYIHANSRQISIEQLKQEIALQENGAEAETRYFI